MSAVDNTSEDLVTGLKEAHTLLAEAPLHSHSDPESECCVCQWQIRFDAWFTKYEGVIDG